MPHTVTADPPSLSMTLDAIRSRTAWPELAHLGHCAWMRVEQAGIYCLHCTATDRRYIGYSLALPLRLYAHACALLSGGHLNAAMQADCNQHGPESFVVTILQAGKPDRRQLRPAEVEWMRRHRSTEPAHGYNGPRAAGNPANP